jgi:hypothetical protein
LSKETDHKLSEELVAYLDGELDAPQGRAVEQRLAGDPQARRALEQMDRTWHLLDELDAPAVAADFTRSTLEMATLAASSELAVPRGRAWRRRLLAAAALLAAAVAGFAAVAILVPNPNAQLLRDLPLLENLDQYRQIDNLELLRDLSGEKLFADDDEPAPRRWQAIDDMSPVEKEELARHQEQFRALPAGEQARIRQLHNQVSHAEDAEKLRATMDRYYQWLSTLPPYRWAELLETEPARRAQRVKQFLKEQAKTASRQLGPEDRQTLRRWMEQYATQHEAHVLKSMPELRQPGTKWTAAMRHRVVMGLLYQRWQSGNPALYPPTTAREVADLRKQLSAKARSRLESKSAAEQTRQLDDWLRQAAKEELVARRGEGAPLIPGFNDQLADFFEFQLSDAQRDRLMALPGDEMQQKLREAYLSQTKAKETAGHRLERVPRNPKAAAAAKAKKDAAAVPKGK